MKNSLFPALFAGVLLLAPRAQTQSASDIMALADYRVALDRISSGNAPGARLLLEQGLRRGEIAPESAALLAYLEEKAGQNERARRVLEGVAVPTSLTSAYLSRLNGANVIEIASGNAKTPRNSAVLESSDARIAKLETLLLQIVNNERRGRGLSALNPDARMAGIARAHSAEMRDKKYFAHQSPTPGLREPLDRYQKGTGQTPRLVAENVYRAWGSRSFLTEKDIREAHQALMDSPGHRSNLLLPGATKLGVGIASNAEGHLWITQLFARS